MRPVSAKCSHQTIVAAISQHAGLVVVQDALD